MIAHGGASLIDRKGGGGALQTPWTSDIDGGGYDLNNVGDAYFGSNSIQLFNNGGNGTVRADSFEAIGGGAPYFGSGISWIDGGYENATGMSIGGDGMGGHLIYLNNDGSASFYGGATTIDGSGVTVNRDLGGRFDMVSAINGEILFQIDGGSGGALSCIAPVSAGGTENIIISAMGGILCGAASINIDGSASFASDNFNIDSSGNTTGASLHAGNGFNGTVTSASLVGKTITIVDGIITNVA